MKTPLRILFAAVIVVGCFSPPATAGAAQKHLPCNPHGKPAVLTVRPTSCTLLPPEVMLGDGLNLDHIKWTTFGDRTARFTAIDIDFHAKPLHIRVTGFAYRPRPATCGSRKTVYTRVFIESKVRTGTVRADRCIAYKGKG